MMAAPDIFYSRPPKYDKRFNSSQNYFYVTTQDSIRNQSGKNSEREIKRCLHRLLCNSPFLKLFLRFKWLQNRRFWSDNCGSSIISCNIQGKLEGLYRTREYYYLISHSFVLVKYLHHSPSLRFIWINSLILGSPAHVLHYLHQNTSISRRKYSYIHVWTKFTQEAFQNHNLWKTNLSFPTRLTILSPDIIFFVTFQTYGSFVFLSLSETYLIS